MANFNSLKAQATLKVLAKESKEVADLDSAALACGKCESQAGCRKCTPTREQILAAKYIGTEGVSSRVIEAR